MNETAKQIEVQVDRNPFALTGRRDQNNGGGMVAIASSRQAQEVQAAMAIAKRFPRDEQEAFSRIMQSCQRKGLAEASLYSYPRGGVQVTGPSIRLAEALAQAWGNLDFGVIELEQTEGESTVMAYCIDLQTNTRQTKIFHCPHERHTKIGGVQKLTDPRDIYEVVANQGARRLRACILGVIPGDVIDAAVDQCDKTMKGQNTEPLIDRIRVMATRFKEDFSVTVLMLEKRLQHKLDATNEHELVALRKIYTSLRDGMTKREDWFTTAESPEQPVQQQPEQPPTILGEKPKRSRKAPASATAPAPAQAAPASQPAAPETRGETVEPPTLPAVSFPTISDDKSRLAVVTAIRKATLDSGVTEAQLVDAINAMQLAPPGIPLFQMPSDILGEIVSLWGEIMELARGGKP
jgi:hypothetical protein